MSEKSRQICRFCQKKTKVLFYCEECGVACCSDCLRDDFYDYFICQNCNSRDIDSHDSDGKKICKKCGSENIIKNTQHLKSCPKCHSHKIINVFEKKEELEQKFLELIKNTRSIIIPLKEVINELDLIRHKIKLARDPPIRCYHFPKMESELLELFKAGLYIKDNLLEKIRNHFRHIALNKEYFFEIFQQPNSNVRVIESILDSLISNHESIENYVYNNIKGVNVKFEGFEKNLKFIEKITRLFLPYQQFLNLAEEEKPVYAIKTRLINGLNPDNRFKKSKGILFITNFDLSFVHESGFFKKKRELIFKAPVDDLIKIKDKGKLFKKLFIQFDYGKYEFSLPSNVVSKIIDYIILARSFQSNEIFDSESAKQLQNTELTLNDILKYIEEGINSFFSLKCKYNQNYTIKEEELKSEEKRICEPIYPYYRRYPCPPETLYYNNQIYQHNQKPDYKYEYQNMDPFGKPIFRRDFYGPPYPPTEFYPQDINNPYRYQNYEPNYNHPQQDARNAYNKPSNFEEDFDEKTYLMKKLEQAHTLEQFISPNQNSRQQNFFNNISPIQQQRTGFRSNPNANFNDFHRSHLSDYFAPSDNIGNNPFTNTSINNENISYKNLTELENERHSTIETLKKLDIEFDKGNINDVDYFKTYKRLQKELYLINKKIKELKSNFEDNNYLRQHYIKDRYHF